MVSARHEQCASTRPTGLMPCRSCRRTHIAWPAIFGGSASRLARSLVSADPRKKPREGVLVFAAKQEDGVIWRVVTKDHWQPTFVEATSRRFSGDVSVLVIGGPVEVAIVI